MKEVSYKCGTGCMHFFAANGEWCINTGLVLGCPSRSVVCVFDSSWVGLYLTGSWWSLFARLCLCAFIILNQESFSTAYTVHTMSHINWMRMRRLIGHFYANIYFS